MQRTLAIIKPDAVAAGHCGEILSLIEKSGFRIMGLRMTRLRREQAEGFYAVHRGKPFYESLVAFMTEGPVVVAAMEADNAVQKWRDCMGATNPANAAEGTIRRRFGSSIERNATHGSDSLENAAVEVSFFFSAADLL